MKKRGFYPILWIIVICILFSILSGCGSKNTSDYSQETSASESVEKSYSIDDNSNNTRASQDQESQETQQYNDTYFQDYGVNPFTDTEEQPLSTFSLDVDTASYSIARKYINAGSLPPQDAIRAEEFINYFKRDYPQPERGMFNIYTEMAPSAFNRGFYMLEVGLQAKNVFSSDMEKTSLTFVIDVSGSMDMDNRLKLVKKSLGILVDQMKETDKIGIVTYGTNGRKLLEPTSASNKNTIMNAINRLKPEGSTNAAEGLLLGYDMANQAFVENGNNRVILCTDGVANQGITNAESILKTVEDYKSRGITLTTLGFGMDNFNDIFLETLADKGDGNYAYIDTLDEAKKVFIDQLTATIQVVAKDAKAQIQFDTDNVESYRLIGYENRALDASDFKNNSVDAGEIGAGHAVTALYEIKLINNPGENIGVVKLRYKNPQGEQITEVSKTMNAAQICKNFYDATPRFRFLTLVAQTAEILKGSPWAGNTSLEEVYDILDNKMKDLDRNKEDTEFIALVKKAMELRGN